MLVRVLRRGGLDVTEARSGRELERQLAEASHADVPDLLITDVHMPGCSGLDVIEELGSRGFPIIVITAFGEAHLHERASRLGVDAIFDKPFDLDDLLAKVQALLDV